MAIGGDLIVELHRFRSGVGQDGWDGQTVLDGLARVLIAAGQVEAAARVWGWSDEPPTEPGADAA
jgi:hypothetical protein